MNARKPPYMPEVDEPENLEKVFVSARQVAAKKADSGARQVVLVTPGRLLLMLECPLRMDRGPVQELEQFMPLPARRISVIAFTELQQIGTSVRSVAQVIPFLGYVLGMSYIGHNVIIFEGHRTALKVGCKEADVLIVDEAMAGFLDPDWQAQAFSVMTENSRILIFGRDRKIVTHQRPTAAPQASPAQQGGTASNSDAIFQQAMAAMKAEQWGNVLTLLTEAIRIDPTQFDSFFYRGVANAKAGKYARAFEDYDQAIVLNPGEAELYAERGSLNLKLGNLNQAAEDYGQAIQRSPGSPKFYLARARVYEKDKAYDRALADYDAAIRLDPRHVAAYTDRGLALAAKGDHKAAVESFSRSLKLDPNFAFAYSFRAESYAALGNFREAVADMERYIQSGLPNRTGSRRQAEDRLKTLKDLARRNRR